MAVTQYIGARYVPVFADPSEWDNTRTYEPLTIVLHNGASYTSAQYVPVGIDILNTEFWQCTGNYNAQVEKYREEVAAFDTRITANADAITAETSRAGAAEKVNADAIAAETSRATNAETALSTSINTVSTVVDTLTAKKHFVALGDSFGVDSVTSPNWWHTYVAEALGLTNHNYCEGYDGFVTTNPNSGRCFLDRAKEAVADSSFDNDDVECVVVYGGLNDRSQTSESLINTAISTLANYLVTNFPNAKIYFAGPTSWCYWTVSNPELANSYGTWEFYMGALIAHNIYMIPRVHFIPIYGLTGHTGLFAGTSDGNHFSANGSKAAAQAILCGIDGGFYDGGVLYGSNAVVKSSDDTTIASNVSWAIRFNGNSFTLECGLPSMQYTASTLEIYFPNRFRLPGALGFHAGLIYRVSDYATATWPPLAKGPDSNHSDSGLEIQFVNTTSTSTYLHYMATHILY